MNNIASKTPITTAEAVPLSLLLLLLHVKMNELLGTNNVLEALRGRCLQNSELKPTETQDLHLSGLCTQMP